MTEALSSINLLANLMGEIIVARNEQRQGFSQIGETITQIDRVTQLNAALAEEVDASVSSLKSKAQEFLVLQKITAIDFFQ